MLINDALKDLEKRRERFLSWRDAEKIALEVKENFSKNGLNILVDLDWITATDGMHIEVYQVKNMDDLKPIFRYLAQNGFQRLNRKPSIVGNYNLIVWYYENIQLNAYFTSKDENACKFIQTGTQEIPVYEIDCPGLEKEVSHVSGNPTKNSADGIPGV